MASVKKAWIRDYGEEEGLRRWNEHKKNFGKTTEQLIEIHGEERVLEINNKKKTFSLEACIERYGEEDGRKKWDERLAKKLKTQKNNFKNKKWKNGRTLQEYQERFGIEDGYKKWSERNRIQSYKVSKQYYIDQYGEEMGPILCTKAKDHSSETFFISKYGPVEGPLKYKENCKKYGITLDKMISLYGETEGHIRYERWLRLSYENSRAVIGNGVSQISQKFLWEVYNKLPTELQDDSYFYELNSEYVFYVNNELGYPKKLIVVDFKCRNVIVEFDCEHWHNDVIDTLRDRLLSSKGYITIRVDYNDYNANNLRVVDETVNEIKNKVLI